jgi:cell division transport system permease protein
MAGLLLGQAVLQHSLDEIKQKVDVAVYFNTGTSEDRILTLKGSLEGLAEVKEVEYISAADALKEFRDKHKSDYLIIRALDEINNNPLGASLTVKAKDSSQYESIAKFLEAADDEGTLINRVNYYQNKVVIDRLNTIITGAERIGFLATLILIVITFVVTFNTIRLTIYTSREEIGVMRLVGADNKQIRGPFMVEGIIYGLISSLVAVIIFFPITYWFGRNMTDFFSFNLFEYYTENFLQVFGILFVTGVLLGSLSSFFAIRKYLKK